jgi:hypothetical protein
MSQARLTEKILIIVRGDEEFAAADCDSSDRWVNPKIQDFWGIGAASEANSGGLSRALLVKQGTGLWKPRRRLKTAAP